MSLALDLTGRLPANKVTNELHNVTLQVDRYIVPDQGAFYGEGLIVTNQANGELLRPLLDYSLYEPVTEVWNQLGVGVYKILHVHNHLVAAVTLTYQALGGDYQYTAAQLETEIGNLVAGGGTFPFGHVSDMPRGGLPPMLHPEDGTEIYDASKVVLSLNHISDALMNGDRLALGHIVQYSLNLADNYHARAVAEINAVNNRLTELSTNLDQGIGDIVITDNPTPPNVRRGYGQFQLNPDVLLIGASDESEIGQMEGLAAGSDYYARRTFIFSQVEDLGQVTYAMAASATAINEGQSVTFTLTTTGLTAGTKVPYRITGTTGFTAADIAGTPLNGNFTVDGDGLATLTVTAAADSLTEGTESFTIRITPVTNVDRTVTINDTSKSPSVSLRFSAAANGSGTITQANEGTTAYLVITSSNIPADHEVNIAYGGSALAGDFQGTRPATVVLDNSGTTIIPFVIIADQITDGNRTLIPTITSDIITTGISTTLNIIDTSQTPVYTIAWRNYNDSANITSISEVNSSDRYAIFKATGSGPANGTLFSIGIRGTATRAVNKTNGDYYLSKGLSYAAGGALDDDVIGTAGVAAAGGNIVLTDILSFNSGTGQFRHATSGGWLALYAIIDALTEGAETIIIDLLPGGAFTAGSAYPTALASSSALTINDTSQDPNVDVGFYNNADGTGSKLTQTNEGTSFYVVIKTTDVPTGTVYTIEYAGSTTNADDFTTTLPTSLTINSSGRASSAFTVKNDFSTEGTETLQLQVKRANGTIAGSTSLTINDTSVNSTTSGAWHSNTAGTAPISTVNEGQTAYLHFTGTNMPAAAVINLTHPTGAGLTNAADFTTTLPTQVTLNASGKGYATYTLKNDLSLEGDETLRVVATYLGAEVGTFDLTVVDTSVPTLAMTFSLSSAGTGTISSVDEGVQFYLVVQGSGYVSGDAFELTYSGALPLHESPTVETKVTNAILGSDGKVIIPLYYPNNMTTDGSRTLTVTAKKSGVTVRTATLTVNDTSKTPTYALSWSMSPSGTPTVSNAPDNNPSPAYLVVTTTNLPDHTLLILRKNANQDYIPENYYDPMPDSFMVGVVSNRATYPVNLRYENNFAAHLAMFRNSENQTSAKRGWLRPTVMGYLHVRLANSYSFLTVDNKHKLTLGNQSNNLYVKENELTESPWNESSSNEFWFSESREQILYVGKVTQAAIDRGAKYITVEIRRITGNALVHSITVPVSSAAY